MSNNVLEFWILMKILDNKIENYVFSKFKKFLRRELLELLRHATRLKKTRYHYCAELHGEFSELTLS